MIKKKIKKQKNGLQNKMISPIFTDKRGSIFDLVEDKVGHIGLITFNKGAERGNHYHKRSVQYSYILEGKLILTTSNINGDGKTETLLMPGMLSIIPAKIVHTYKAITKAKMIDITTMSRTDNGYEKDTIRITK